MVWYWGFLIFFIVVMATSLGLGYVRAIPRVGREAARRNIRSTLPAMLLLFSLALVIPLLGKYGWVSFYIFWSVVVSVGLLTWFFRKKEFGNLLISIEQPSNSMFLFWIGVFDALMTVVYTLAFFVQVLEGLPQSRSLEVELSQLVFYWVLVIFSLAFALSRIEFRENGICIMFTFLNWQRINSYNWEQPQDNILTIRFKPRFPLVPGFLSMPIPTKHREAVNQILDERLPGKNL